MDIPSEDDDTQYYRLRGFKLYKCSLGEWADSLAKDEHILEDTLIPIKNKRLLRVVTCLMGYDLRADYQEEEDELVPESPDKPLLFETTVISPVALPEEVEDCYSSTVLEAKEAHYSLTRLIKTYLATIGLLASTNK